MSKIPVEKTLDELNELRMRERHIGGFMANIRLRYSPRFVRIVFPIVWSQRFEDFPREYTSLMYEFLGKEHSKVFKEIALLEDRLRKVK